MKLGPLALTSCLTVRLKSCLLNFSMCLFRRRRLLLSTFLGRPTFSRFPASRPRPEALSRMRCAHDFDILHFYAISVYEAPASLRKYTANARFSDILHLKTMFVVGMESISELMFREHGLHYSKVMTGLPITVHDTTGQAHGACHENPTAVTR